MIRIRGYQVCLFVLFLCIASNVATAQVKVPVFDVYSVRSSKSGTNNMSMSWHDDAFDVENARLSFLLQVAFKIRPAQINGLPKWATAERFNIHAKVSDYDPVLMKSLTPDQKLEMQKRFLLDAFKLAIHEETKELPVYVLVLAGHNSNLRLGDAVAESDEGKKKGVGSMSVSDSSLTMTDGKVSDIANAVAQIVEREVIDKTELTGRYDATLHWAPEHPSTTATGETGPSIYTALQEQLGLKLLPSRAPVRTLVVDHIEVPQEN